MSRPLSWGESPMAAQRDDRQRPLPSAQCSLCGMAFPTSLLVPDGGQACADIRWVLPGCQILHRALDG